MPFLLTKIISALNKSAYTTLADNTPYTQQLEYYAKVWGHSFDSYNGVMSV